MKKFYRFSLIKIQYFSRHIRFIESYNFSERQELNWFSAKYCGKLNQLDLIFVINRKSVNLKSVCSDLKWSKCIIFICRGLYQKLYRSIDLIFKKIFLHLTILLKMSKGIFLYKFLQFFKNQKSVT